MTIEIQLTQGQIATVSDEDDDLKYLKWYAQFFPHYAGGGKFLAVRKTPFINGKRTTQLVHRVVLSRMIGRELLSSEFVDHINGDTLCDIRSNLRLATHAQNMRNSGKHVNNTSGFKGVYKSKNRWCAQISVNGKTKHLGHFSTAKEAHDAYSKAAIELHGEFANLG